jgi:hypothetical protein
VLAAQKNDVWLLWSGPDRLVRSQGAACARSVVRRHADFSGIRGAAPRLVSGCSRSRSEGCVNRLVSVTLSKVLEARCRAPSTAQRDQLPSDSSVAYFGPRNRRAHSRPGAFLCAQARGQFYQPATTGGASYRGACEAASADRRKAWSFVNRSFPNPIKSGTSVGNCNTIQLL